MASTSRQNIVLSTIFMKCFIALISAVTINTTVENETNATVMMEDTTDPYSSLKNSSISSCYAFELEPGDYIMFQNKTIYVEVYNKSYDPLSYTRVGETVIVCAPLEEIEEHEDTPRKSLTDYNLTYITVVGLGISMFFLTLHLIAFFIVPDMRNLPGYNLASLCFSLLFAYISYMVAYSQTQTDNKALCISGALGMQYFMLSAFMWMSALAFDVFRSLLKATGKLQLASLRFKCKKYCMYCLYSWGIPILFIIVTLILDNTMSTPKIFRPQFGDDGVCWFRERIALLLLFAAPVMLIISVNFILFGLSAYIIYANRMRVEGGDMSKTQLKKNFLMYGRLATIMGLTWFVATLVQNIRFPWLWYIDLLLNTFQGVFIFLAFTCTHKVKKHFKMIFCQKRRPSCQSQSVPTFQSYWNAGLSVDNEMDLTSEANIVKSEKTEKV